MGEINIPAVLIANGISIVILLYMLFSSQRTMQHRLPDNRLFYAMVGANMLLSILEAVTFMLDGAETPELHLPLLALNVLLYITLVVFSFIWTVYADYKLFSDMSRIKRIYPYIAIPAIITALLCLTNLFVPVFFSISDTNEYSRTGINFVTYVIAYGYMFYGVILIYTNRRKGNRYLFMPALLFALPMLAGSLIQFFNYGISLMWIGATIALLSLYINVQNEVSYVDTLSGLFNRQYLNIVLDSEYRKTSRKKQLAGIMLDIDRFKNINDSFGHLTGDDAITSAGTILRSCTPSGGFVSRFAGDEFVIICYIDDKNELVKLTKLIKNRAEEFNITANKPYSLSFSIGCAVLYEVRDDTIDSFINRMDKAMYDNKKALIS